MRTISLEQYNDSPYPTHYCAPKEVSDQEQYEHRMQFMQFKGELLQNKSLPKTEDCGMRDRNITKINIQDNKNGPWSWCLQKMHKPRAYDLKTTRLIKSKELIRQHGAGVTEIL